jgi:hypothetical protein
VTSLCIRTVHRTNLSCCISGSVFRDLPDTRCNRCRCDLKPSHSSEATEVGDDTLDGRAKLTKTKTNKLHGPWSASELYGLSDRQLSTKFSANCRRNLVPTFVDRGVSRGHRGGSPTVVNLNFLDRTKLTARQSFMHECYQVSGQGSVVWVLKKII